MRKTLIITLILSILLFGGCTKKEDSIKEIKIGISLYRSDDAFITSIKDYIVKAAKEREIKDNVKITLDVLDASGQQSIQNDQVDGFISQKYNVICVNMADRTAAAVIIDKAKAADIPVVFFNREPVAEDMERWEKLYYVGAAAGQSGVIQGEIIYKLFSANPERVDKNGDGIIQYVMLEGELGHQDSLLRTEYSVRTLITMGVEVEKLANDSAAWKRSLGKEKMSSWLNDFGNSIEVVFSNNDEMALGAIEAMKDYGYTFSVDDNIIVVGIDATVAGLEAVKNGQMYATVFNDAYGQGKGIFEIAYSYVTTGNADTEVEGFDGKYLFTNYEEVTLSNVDKFEERK